MALSFVGRSNVVATNGGAPTAITPHANTQTGDFLIFFFYSAVTGGDETVSLSNFTAIFDGVSANNGLVKAAYRVRQAGDTTYTPTVTNHTSSTSGESIVCYIDTWRGVDDTTPIGDVSTSLSTATADTTSVGPIAATGISTVPDRSALVVAWGRHDDMGTVSQTALTGHSLTWTAQTPQETTSGADASQGYQYGLNATGSAVGSITAKTVTIPTADSATSVGYMFVLNAGPDPTEPAFVGSDTSPVTTETFDPPDNSLLVALCSCTDGGAGTVTDSIDGGTGWVRKAQVTTSTSLGNAEIWMKDITTGAPMTVSLANAGGHSAIKVRALTGFAAKADQTATPVIQNAGTDGAVDVTTTATGSRVMLAAAYWTDTINLTPNGNTTEHGEYDAGNAATGATGESTSTTGTPGSTTFGWTETGLSATLGIAAMEILPDAIDYTQTSNDSAGAADTAALTRNATFSDDAAPTDTAVISLGLDVTTSDNTVPTDSATSIWARAAAPSDDVGITDTTTIDKSGVGTLDQTDLAGLVDTITFDRDAVTADDTGTTDGSPAVTRTGLVVDSITSTDSASVDVTSGTDYTQTPSDDAVPTDAIILGWDRVSTQFDNAGAIDTPVLEVSQTTSDDAVSIDNVGLALGRGVSIVDNAGLADTPALDLAPTVADSVGTTDTVAVDKSGVGTLDRTDLVGLVDAITSDRDAITADGTGTTDGSPAVTRTGLVANWVALTDSASIDKTSGGTDYTQTPSDDAGVADTPALDFAPAVADSTGTTDTFTIDKSGAGTVDRTDPAGPTDAIIVDWSLVAADTAGLVDVATLDLALTTVDAAGPVDASSIEKSGAGNVERTDDAGSTSAARFDRSAVAVDSAGATDTASIGKSSDLTATDATESVDAFQSDRTMLAVDLAAPTDTSAGAVGYARTFVDVVGINDAVSISQSGSTSLVPEDGAGLRDATAVVRNVAIVSSAGLTDTHERGAIYADSAGASDTIAISRTGFGVDSAGAADSVTFDRTASVTDPAGLVEATARIRGLSASDPVGVTESAELTHGRTGVDSAGASDAVVLAITVDVVDPAGLDDNVAALVTVTVADETGVRDEVLVVNGLLRQVTVVAVLAAQTRIAATLAPDTRITVNLGSQRIVAYLGGQP